MIRISWKYGYRPKTNKEARKMRSCHICENEEIQDNHIFCKICGALQRGALDQAPARESMYYLMDLERSIGSGTVYYWKGGGRGYTSSLDEAGLYDEKEALDRARVDADRTTIPIKAETVNNIMNFNK
jgi:hypothetical protein